MTSVICWKNTEGNNENLWIVADSRISSTGQSGVQILNDMCPKVFSIPIKIKFSDNYPFSIEVSSICFAFSGNTLIAQLTKDSLNLMLSSLNEMDDGHEFMSQYYSTKHLSITLPVVQNEIKNIIISKLPSLQEISEFTVQILKSVLMSYASSTGHAKTPIEILISGYCHKTKVLKTFTIKWIPPIDIQQTIEKIELINVEEHIFSTENAYCILGDHKESIRESILNEARSTNELVSKRAPLYALASNIDQDVFLSIGGYLQLARCHILGCTINGFTKPDIGFFYTGFKPHAQGKDGNLWFKTLGKFIVSPPTMRYPEKSDHDCKSGTLQTKES